MYFVSNIHLHLRAFASFSWTEATAGAFMGRKRELSSRAEKSLKQSTPRTRDKRNVRFYLWRIQWNDEVDVYRHQQTRTARMCATNHSKFLWWDAPAQPKIDCIRAKNTSCVFCKTSRLSYKDCCHRCINTLSLYMHSCPTLTRSITEALKEAMYHFIRMARRRVPPTVLSGPMGE